MVRNGVFSGLLLLLALASVDGALFTNRRKKKTESKLKTLGIHTAELKNGKDIPLVGLGVGNLNHMLIPKMVADSLQESRKVHLIDTAHASQNEALVAQGIISGAETYAQSKGDPSEKLEVHVVTKVWYTHLGYERTKISVDESLAALKAAADHKNVDLKVHFLIHWPRCYDAVAWMDCAGEEDKLPAEIKNAGPAPHLDKEGAWKGSWKALEEAYEANPLIESIGVSNFHLQDMEKLEALAKVQPHMIQLNVWSLLFDPYLIEFCHSHDIHIMAFNIMHGIATQHEKAPHAYHRLQKVANDLTNEGTMEVTPSQVIMAWLVQHGITVIPRTTSAIHANENSAVSISQIPALMDTQSEAVATAIEAILSGDDLEDDINVNAHFTAKTKDIFLFWRNHEGDEIQIASIHVGETFNETTFPGHLFRVYDQQDADSYIDYQIKANFGDSEHFHVEF